MDIRDTEQVWCKGEIAQIYYKDLEVVSVLVHYDRWHKMYDEILYLPNIRIANLGFFTSRTNISFYNLTQSENNLRGQVRVLSANERHEEVNESESNNSDEDEVIE